MTNKQICEMGTLIDKWPCDVDEFGDQMSNGSQESIYEYDGKKFWLWMKWNDEPVEPGAEAVRWME